MTPGAPPTTPHRRVVVADSRRDLLPLLSDYNLCPPAGGWQEGRRPAGRSLDLERVPDIVPRRTSSVSSPAVARGSKVRFGSESIAEVADGDHAAMMAMRMRLGRGGAQGTARWLGAIEMTAVSPIRDRDRGEGGEPPEVLKFYEQAVLDLAQPPAVSESLSEVLLNGSSIGRISSDVEPGGPSTVESAVQVEESPISGPELPEAVVKSLLKYTDDTDHLALKLTCRAWFRSITAAAPLKRPAVSQLPPELIQHIYSFLAPADFNSARHTSRAWLAAGLDKSLLLTMLKRGGWLGAVDHRSAADLTAAHKMSEEWWLSKCLSRECSLGPHWRGDGLPRLAKTSRRGRDRLSPGRDRRRGARSTSLEVTSVTDFSAIVSNYSDVEDLPGSSVHFTVSVCGRYVLVAEGCLVYIYRLSGRDSGEGAFLGGSLSPVTSVLCPRRVLAVSMDTSCERYAVAALLDGRMGMVCDIRGSMQRSPPAGGAFDPEPVTEPGPSTGALPGPSTFRVADGDLAFSEEELAVITNELEGSSRIWAAAGSGSSSISSGNMALARLDAPGTETAMLPVVGGIPVEMSPSAVYRNLCSADDPPISVAICPQRKCVAFGCVGGIELHWVDALTGQDLSRWFPLTTPSDFLYFLPPRRGVDSAKKLRLISSAGHPGGSAPLSHRFNARRAATSPFWNMYFTPQFSGLQSSVSDHFRAVPLSDGYHILFIDPSTGLLCLGSDAPAGGPTKLLRKIILLGPDGESPTLYASGSDLRWGVRVVAGFGDRVWLFSVPPDVFYDSSHCYRACGWSSNNLWADGWLAAAAEDKAEDGPGPGFSQDPWPLRIRGAEVGRVQGLVDIAVESGPDMIIWTFCAGGKVYTWQIEGGFGGAQGVVGVRRRVVLREGAVVG
ncbi:MAG: hypothetical protein M1839_004943 [Geoglossum umbratile]|nr:MAG: hypothetical protein M1839_004943 [Geoglossum umbratile]